MIESKKMIQTIIYLNLMKTQTQEVHLFTMILTNIINKLYF